MSNTTIMRDAERFIKRMVEYEDNRDDGNDENFEIHFVLKKSDKSAVTDVIAHATHIDMGISFRPYSNDVINYYYYDDVIYFSYDNDLFGMLEDGYEIAGISKDAHCCIWYDIEEGQNDGFTHAAGMQMYLGYCKRNGVTLEKLRQSVSYDGIDVMTLYDGKTKPGIASAKHRNDFSR